MISIEISTWFTLVLYALASVLGLVGMLMRSPLLRCTGCWVAALAFACQTFWLIMGVHKQLPDGLSIGAYSQLLAWFATLCGLGLWWRMKQETSLFFTSALALLLFAISAPYMGAVIHVPSSLKAPFFTLHIGSLFLSLGLLTVGFTASALFLFLEKRIKSKQRMMGFWQDMPALNMLDKTNAFTTMTAFPLYTVGIVSGLIWAKPVYGATVTGDPKEVISFVIWLIFAFLFHNRLSNGWRGRKPAQLTVCIYALCLLSIVVVNIFMDSHHTFIRPNGQ